MTSRTDLAAELPAPEEVPRLYHELARIGARAEGRKVPWRFGHPSPEALVVLAAQASRREPRLLWVVVALLAEGYSRFDLLELRRRNAAARWPAATAVAFEFAKRARPSQELSDVGDFLFRRISRGPGEQFFISARSFGGPLSRRDAEESLAEYKRWGYLSREEPLAKELGPTARGSLGPAERRNVLRRLADRVVDFGLADYVEALQGRASLRQASRDLARAEFLSRRGATRAARYFLRRPRGP